MTDTKTTSTGTSGATQPVKTKKRKPEFFSFENLRSLGTLALIIMAFRWTVAAPYKVPTASMEPTIKVGDRLIAWKLSYDLKIPFTDYALFTWAKPKRGDIIVFKYPGDPSIDYVKRIVAIEGDQLQIIDDVLYINGEAQNRTDHNQDRSVLNDIHDFKDSKILFRENLSGKEHWVMHSIPSKRSYSNKFWPSISSETHKIPPGSVFCMGDNRDNSNDSRVWGEVPLSSVRGKALFVLWSMYDRDDSMLPLMRWYRFGRMLDSM